jgi:hypothetical protein
MTPWSGLIREGAARHPGAEAITLANTVRE